jgi:hypothetical protein
MKVIRIVGCLLLANAAWGQNGGKKNWELSSALSYGSENNMGHYGFGIANRLTFHFHRTLSGSAEFMVFSSIPSAYPGQYSAVSGGLLVNHTASFKEGRRFVRASAGVAHLVSTMSGYGPDDGNSAYPALLMNLEGGGNISDKVSMGLTISTFTSQIFGEIIMLGVNFSVRLW